MLNFTVIGTGAAGNKAVSDLVAAGYTSENCYYINSTDRDIPKRSNPDNIIIFGNGLGGCGKERSIGKKMLLEDLSRGNVDLDNIYIGNNNGVIIVGSCEGGSGSASIPILAKYYKEVHDIPVIVVLFFGFHDDVRGIQNTIELMQELSDEYTVIAIDNDKFSYDDKGIKANNRFAAEKAANAKFVDIVKILSGIYIKPGDQIIDDTDLYKIVTTPGYMIADSVSLPDRIKSEAALYNNMDYAITNHNFVDPPKDAAVKRIGVIFNLAFIDPSIDYKASKLNEQYGNPYELFLSVSENNRQNTFHYICSGMKFPIDEINKMYDEYNRRSQSVDKTQDDFFGFAASLKGDSEDSKFDMLNKKKAANTAAKKNFFADFGIQQFVDGDTIKQTGAMSKDNQKDY